MNGEVKSYKMNSPMKWKEFRSLPDDLKITYIKALRDKYKVTDKTIADMMGICKATLSKETVRLGISTGTRGKTKDFDAVGWKIFTGEYIEEKVEELTQEDITLPVLVPTNEELSSHFHKLVGDAFGPSSTMASEAITRAMYNPNDDIEMIAPESGNMHFKGSTDGILKSIKALLGNGDYIIDITWLKKKEDNV